MNYHKTISSFKNFRIIKHIAIIIVLFYFMIPEINSAILIAQEDSDFSEIVQIVREGKYKDAIPMLREYNSHYPDRSEGWVMLGNIYLAIGGFNKQDKAVRAYKEGLQRDPDNTIILQRLADISKNRQRSDYAIVYLEKAINAAPSDWKLLEQLLDNYILEERMEEMKNLELQVEKWVNSYPDSIGIYVNLAKLYLALNKPKSAIEILRKGINVRPDFSPLHRIMADAYYNTGNEAAFTEIYYLWLTLENDPSLLEKEYHVAELTMSVEQVREFKELPFKNRSDYLLKYWRAQDPNPISIQNERLVEHFKRVYYANKHFRAHSSRYGFDDRGKVYIRWGPPEEKYSNSMPTLSPGFYKNPPVMTSNGGEISSPKPLTVSLRGNESWYYPSIGYYLAFDFVNFGGFYREVPSLADAYVGIGIATDVSQPNSWGEMANLRELYRERSHLGGIYGSLSQRTVSSFVTDLLFDIPSEKTNARLNLEPRFELSLAIPPLDFTFRPYQFRGDSGRTKVEIAYGLELDQLKPKPHHDTTFTFHFQNDLVFFDTRNQRVLHRQFWQDRTYPPKYNFNKISITGETVCKIFPGDYDIVYQMVETANRKGKFYKEKVSVRNFSGTNLMISDLKLSPEIEFLGTDNQAGFDRIKVMPYPFSRVIQEYPIYVYFEIYNLGLLPEQGTKYEISLKLDREVKSGEFSSELLHSFGNIFTRGQPKRIETSYQREGNSDVSYEYIELDLSALKQGHSRLTVTVKDLNTGISSENNIEFDFKNL